MYLKIKIFKNKIMFNCQRCGLNFSQKIILIKHLNKKNKCIPTENNVDTIVLIERLNKKEGIECKICHRVYKNNNSLRAHHCISSKNKVLEDNSLYKDIKETVTVLKNQYQTLLNTVTSTLKRHNYVKFNKSDPCFYIIESGNQNSDKIQYKFGISGTAKNSTIDDRLKNHRTLWPLLMVRYLLFTKDVFMIEKNVKMMYEKEINPNGHEIIESVPLENITKRIQKLIDILGIENYDILPEEKLKEYNEYVKLSNKNL